MMSAFANGTTRRIVSIPRPGRLFQFIQAWLLAPKMAEAEVRRVLAYYDLPLTRSPQNLPFGWRNRNVMVHTPRGKKVLKQVRDDWSEARLVHEHSILNYLQAKDFPAPRLVYTPDGQSYVKVHGHKYALFDFVDGSNLAGSFVSRRQRTQLVAQAGQFLAQYHRQMAGFLPAGGHHLGIVADTGKRRRDLQWHLDRLETLPGPSGRFSGETAAHLRWLVSQRQKITNRLGELDAKLAEAPLSRLVIHGDYGLHNLHFHKDGSITLHDFELARLEWRLVDMVGVLTRMNEVDKRTFVQAYQSEYPFDDAEWEHFPAVWEYYRLRGAVQYWNAFFEMGDPQRLAAARRRIEKAEWARQHSRQLRQLLTPRIMMVVRLFYPWIGGTERQAHKLARALVRRETPVELSTGWWFRGTPQQETLDGIPIYRNQTLWHFFDIKGLRKFGGFLYIGSLLWHLWRRRNNYDLIHVHGLSYHTFTAVVAGRWLKRPVIAKLANSGMASDIGKMRANQHLPFTRQMLPIALQCNRFVALNTTVRQELMAAGVPPQRIVEIPNGVEIADVQAKTDYTLHTPVRLIFVGRLHDQKGLDILLYALQMLRKASPGREICLQLLGDGPLRAQLIALTDQLGLTSWVEFAGKSDRVMAHLQQSDIFVLPSRAEGLSNALLEAMSCGLPVLVSNVPGNTDLIQDGKNGLLFQGEDANSLQDQLMRLLDDSALRQRLGTSARTTIERAYSLKHVAGCYVQLYRSILGDRSGPFAEGKATIREG